MQLLFAVSLSFFLSFYLKCKIGLQNCFVCLAVYALCLVSKRTRLSFIYCYLE